MGDATKPALEMPSASPRAADHAVIDLLRVGDGLGIGEMATSLRVTATAVRQRLDRLMRQGLVERSARGGRRGRPSHTYRLTEAGRRVGGDNFQDLAVVLWREIRGITEAGVRRGLLGRIGASLAGLHRERVRGDTPRERLHDVAALLRGSDIACVVEEPATSPGAGDGRGGLPVLTSYACPYPGLAEMDRGVCAAERLMIEELVGQPVRLSECRLDGGSCCRFSMVERGEDAGSDGGIPTDLQVEATPRRMPIPPSADTDRPMPVRGHPAASPSNATSEFPT